MKYEKFNFFSGIAAAIVVFLLALFGSCMQSCTFDHPLLDWDIEDQQPVVQDTVCTTYDPILLPEFITAYMEMDPYQTIRVLRVGSNIDTIQSGENIQISLDSLIGLIVPNFTRKVYVNDLNDRLMSVHIKGTNDKNILLGKLRIDYNGYRHYFGCISQSLIVAGSQTESEFEENINEFPSFKLINWRNTFWDSLVYNKHMALALDTANCKGCREWFQTHFNPFLAPPQFLAYATLAGCENVTGAMQIPQGQTVYLDNRSSDSQIMYWLEKGYSVKTRL